LGVGAVGVGGFVEEADLPLGVGFGGGAAGPVELRLGQAAALAQVVGVQDDEGRVLILEAVIHPGGGVLFGQVLEVEVGHQGVGLGDPRHAGPVLVVAGGGQGGQSLGVGAVQHHGPVVFVAAVVHKVAGVDQELRLGEGLAR